MNTTPGPWEYFPSKDSNDDETFSIRGNGQFLATMDTVSINGGAYRAPANAEANARLMAAAPTLLATLMAVWEDMNEADCDYSPTIATYHAVKDAITNAGGEPR